MKHKIFIDGQEGTTGLKIFDRIKSRNDLELITIESENRKNIEARLEKIKEADITFLCLPDQASKEIVERADGNSRILDTSTAHRTHEDWVYGLPELCPEQRDRIRSSNRIAVPGCHATGFITLVKPLTALGIAPKDYPFDCHSITGYSGGGKKMIAQYAEDAKTIELEAPRQYGLSQSHKHMKEIVKQSDIEFPPSFHPIVADYFQGMLVTVSLHTRLLEKKVTVSELHEIFSDYYKEQKLIKVADYDEDAEKGFLESNRMGGKDSLQIFVVGNDERITLVSRFDNLGKGASGAAVQCMNIMLGCPEDTGLVLA
ncbi:MAG: N-acetyl-gamma-glutamyl-phosphate reductase [Anaerovoracaceae bacterium]